ncbi:fibrobacter succinogenes major paralogous domain-containing protein [Flavobacterium hercynium]|nr:FISUMP domain-containing protein [Flavobacterium hercynium]SMP29903.1 major paralogous domain-containing protein [Flavobacterium hercynium]
MKNCILSVTLLISYSLFSQVGIGIPNPDASAVLELASKQKGFLPPRLTTAERDAISNPAEGLTIFNTTKNCLEWYNPSGWYNACGDNGVATVTAYTCNTLETGTMEAGTPVSGVSQTITVTVSVPGSYDISATENGVTFSARGNFTSAGNHDIVLHATGIPLVAGNHTFALNTSPNSCSFSRITDIKIITVIGAGGRTWMAFNLGATAPATSMTDAAQYGDYYQWGRGTDGHEKMNSPRISTQSQGDSPGHGNFITNTSNWRSTTNVNLWQGINGINNPCPAGFRVPTITEWNQEFSNSNIKDMPTAFSSVLKLPAAGYRANNNASYSNLGVEGRYWSSDTSGLRVNYKLLDTGQNSRSGADQANGMSVRCIKD